MPKATKQFRSYAEQLKRVYRDTLAKKIKEDLSKTDGMSTVEEIIDLFNSYLECESPSKIETKIIDPLSRGPIRLVSPIDELLSLPIINRLRSIRQLSFSFLSYPSANHTRFEHSVGVYYLAQQLLEVPAVKRISDEETSKAFLIAALLHDVGQGPGSHSIEKLFGAKYDQIKTIQIVSAPELRKLGIRDVLEENLRRKVLQILPNGKPLTKKDKLCLFFRESLDSEIDIDRLDFLNRDAYFCGLLTGRVDPLHIIEYIDPSEIDVGYKYAFSKDPHALEFINGAISARSELYPLVYQDEKRMAADEAFCHAFFASCRFWSPDKWMIVANKMIYLNDHQVLALMQAFGDTYVREFVSHILNGEILYVKAYETRIPYPKKEDSIQFRFWDMLWGKPFELIVLLECAFCDLFGIKKSDFEPSFFIRYPLRGPMEEKKEKKVLINTKEALPKDIRRFSDTASALLDTVLPTYDKLFFFADFKFAQRINTVLKKIFTEKKVGESFLGEVENIISPIGAFPTLDKAKFSEGFRRTIFD